MGVIGVVLVTEAEQTQRVIVALIVVLLIVAAILALLTLWYWRHTNPRRAARQMFPEPQGADLDLRRRYGYDSNAPVANQHWGDVPDPYADPDRDPRYANERYVDDPYRDARQRHLT